MEYGFSQTLNAKQTRRSATPGHPYSKHFEDKEFVVLLKNDASTKLSKEIYKNIMKSGLHRTTVRTPILPCLDVV